MLPNLSLNLGLRWIVLISPYRTKYDQQSQFDPNAMDPGDRVEGRDHASPRAPSASAI